MLRPVSLVKPGVLPSCLMLGCGLFVAWPRLAVAVAGDEHWSAQFGNPGISTIVRAITRYRDRLYVGGEGTTTNTTVTVWDGSQWSGIGLFSGSNPVVYDLAWSGNSLYAAGVFTNVNGTNIKGLARWDGVNWTDLGYNGNAYALLVDGADLYVGGSFTNAGSVAVTNVARWNGSTWSAVGSGVGRTGAGFVLALLKLNGVLYAGGSFTNAGMAAATNLAQWNGVTWTNVGSGLGTAVFPERVYALGAKDNQLHAGGIFSSAGALPASGIARWDGANWSALGSGIGGGGTVLSFANFGASLCVAGSFTSAGGVNATNFAIWNGSSWSAAAGGGLNAVAYRAVGGATDTIVGGYFFTAGNKVVNQIASWDGATWSPIGAPGKIQGVSSAVRALGNDGTNLFAGGLFGYAGQTNAQYVGRFDGTNWTAFGTGLNNSVLALAAIGTNVYAGGTFTGSPGGPSVSHVARWNGANWVPLTNFYSTIVNALAVRGNDLFIAGYFAANAADGTANWLARWDGTNLWTAMAFGPDTFNLFYIDNIGFTAVAADANYVYVSGRCSITPCDPTWTDCTNCQNVMRFDGAYMHEMGTGLSSNANAIAVLGTDVYFGGPFTNAGGVTVSGIARWDGASWHNVGGGIVGRGNILALAVMDGNLYVGGTFTNIGGVPANRIARWNGSTWSALGSGVAFSATSGTISALTAIGNDLYVGGTFRTAGGKPANFLSRWNENRNFDEFALRLSQPAMTPGGAFQFAVTSVGVPAYVIDHSTNLSSWTPFLTNTITPYDCYDSGDPTAQRRFYRARSQP